MFSHGSLPFLSMTGMSRNMHPPRRGSRFTVRADAVRVPIFFPLLNAYISASLFIMILIAFCVIVCNSRITIRYSEFRKMQPKLRLKAVCFCFSVCERFPCIYRWFAYVKMHDQTRDVNSLLGVSFFFLTWYFLV